MKIHLFSIENGGKTQTQARHTKTPGNLHENEPEYKCDNRTKFKQNRVNNSEIYWLYKQVRSLWKHILFIFKRSLTSEVDKLPMNL